MGCTDSQERKDKAAKQLNSIFQLNDKDFVRVGDQDDLINFYDVLEQESQSHSNVSTGLLRDKITGETKFCKTVTVDQQLSQQLYTNTCNFMAEISHSIVVKFNEIYKSSDKIYLVSPNLSSMYKPLAELGEVLDEYQVILIIEQLLQMCVRLHKSSVTVAYLHPNNIFVDEDNPEAILVTDVGFAYMPGVHAETQLQAKFQAPEIRGLSGNELSKVVQDAPGQADLKSIGLIAMYLLTGSTDYTSEDLSEDVCSKGMIEFIRKTEDENPYQRLRADSLLKLNLFNKESLAGLLKDTEMLEKRNQQKSIIGGRMKALGQASVMEQIMVRFVSSAQQNQQQLAKCREQYRHLIQEQNADNDENDVFQDQLTFATVREELLKGNTGAEEMQRILKKLDVNYDARISFDEFQAAMMSSFAEQDDAVLRSSFHRLDINGDKYLTIDEITKTLTDNEESLHRIRKVEGFHYEIADFITSNDKDGNRKLDADEFAQAMKKFAVTDTTESTPEGDIEPNQDE